SVLWPARVWRPNRWPASGPPKPHCPPAAARPSGGYEPDRRPRPELIGRPPAVHGDHPLRPLRPSWYTAEPHHRPRGRTALRPALATTMAVPRHRRAGPTL